MDFVFSKESAQNADRGGYITAGGVYVGRFTKAIYFSRPSGSVGFEFSFEAEDGGKTDFIQVYTKNKDGSENFAAKKIHSLMGLLNLQKAPIVKNGDAFTCPAFCNRKFAVALQREEYFKGDGSIGFKMNVLHFFDAQTKKTYSEFTGNTEAKTYLKEIKDKILSEGEPVISGVTPGFGQHPATSAESDDLPF